MTIKRSLAAFFALVSACAADRPLALSGWARNNPDWVESVEPFRVDGDIYYVGSRGLSSFLIVSREGHFLIDGGMPENAEMVADSVKALGYDIRDVKYLLNSHAHFDHSGGLAALKEMSGAIMVATKGDCSALEGGFYLGSESDHDFDAPPVKVDRVISDGETLTLGGVTLTAHLTPGHTRGCTTWTMTSGGKQVLFFCSATVANNRLVATKAAPAQYDGIVEAYKSTFAKAKAWRPDIFLANHPGFFDMGERLDRRKAGDADAFVNQTAFPAHLAKMEAAFEQSLAEQAATAESR